MASIKRNVGFIFFKRNGKKVNIMLNGIAEVDEHMEWQNDEKPMQKDQQEIMDDLYFRELENFFENKTIVSRYIFQDQSIIGCYKKTSTGLKNFDIHRHFLRARDKLIKKALKMKKIKNYCSKYGTTTK